jgi:heme/copper-type cytochrome/quinol oxidase subunit 4
VSRTTRIDSLKGNLVVYALILVIAGLQVIVAYSRGTVGQHAVEMLGLATVQSWLGISFFMHLFQEKRSLTLTLLLATLFLLLVMNAFWSDSFRIIYMRSWRN